MKYDVDNNELYIFPPSCDAVEVLSQCPEAVKVWMKKKTEWH